MFSISEDQQKIRLGDAPKELPDAPFIEYGALFNDPPRNKNNEFVFKFKMFCNRTFIIKSYPIYNKCNIRDVCDAMLKYKNHVNQAASFMNGIHEIFGNAIIISCDNPTMSTKEFDMIFTTEELLRQRAYILLQPFEDTDDDKTRNDSTITRDVFAIAKMNYFIKNHIIAIEDALYYLDIIEVHYIKEGYWSEITKPSFMLQASGTKQLIKLVFRYDAVVSDTELSLFIERVHQINAMRYGDKSGRILCMNDQRDIIEIPKDELKAYIERGYKYT